MAETTYYKDKAYLPKEIREKLRQADGDVFHIEAIEKGTAELSEVRRCAQLNELLENRDNSPGRGAIKGKLPRQEIYEDDTGARTELPILRQPFIMFMYNWSRSFYELVCLV